MPLILYLLLRKSSRDGDSSSITANAEGVVSHFAIVRHERGSAMQLEVKSPARTSAFHPLVLNEWIGN